MIDRKRALEIRDEATESYTSILNYMSGNLQSGFGTNVMVELAELVGSLVNLCHQARRIAENLKPGYPGGFSDETKRVAGFALGSEHVLGCDEYHAHHAPECCSTDCWCRKGSKSERHN